MTTGDATMTHNAMYGPARTSNLCEPSVAHTIGRILANRSGIGTRLSESPTATSSAERGIAEAASTAAPVAVAEAAVASPLRMKSILRRTLKLSLFSKRVIRS
eukprot:SAG11_NODE_7370_length_1155_cov_1.077652_1_plen_103_part_00